MENSFEKAPVSPAFKRVQGYIPQTLSRGALAKKFNAVYKAGLCAALECKEGISRVDYTESTVGSLHVFEFTVEHNSKRLKFCHVYDGLFPWSLSKTERKKICDLLKPLIMRRKSFEADIFKDAEVGLAKKLRLATVIPKDKGFKIVFAKGAIAKCEQTFNVFFENT